MNQKGFTLVELLATIVILSVLGVIAYTSVNNYIKTSKEKAEDKFLDGIATDIDSFISLNSKNFKKTGSEISFDKVVYKSEINGTKSYSKHATAWKMECENSVDFKHCDNGFTLQSLITGLKLDGTYENPNTNDVCDAKNIPIEVYKDSDYVYYYFVNMKEAAGCKSSKNIDTRPEGLK